MMNNEVPITASTSKRVVTMKNVVPYDRIARNLSTWPFGSFDSFFDAPYSALSSVSSDAFVMNVEDAGQSYVVTAELPGVSKENIDVELNEGRLSITATRKESEEEKAKNYLHKESSEWQATRGVYLKDAAREGLTAKLDGGILTITVPKQD